MEIPVTASPRPRSHFQPEKTPPDWLERLRPFKRPLIVLFAAAVLAALVYAFASVSRASRDQEALVALFLARDAADRQDAAERPRTLAQVAADFPESALAGAQSHIFAFGAYLDAGDDDGAMRIARAFLERWPRHPMAPRIHLGLATLLTQPARAAEARQELSILSLRHPPELAADVALLSAQIHWAQAFAHPEDSMDRIHSMELAREAFRRIIDQARMSPSADIRSSWRQAAEIAHYQLLLAQDWLAGNPPTEPTPPSPEWFLPDLPPGFSLEGDDWLKYLGDLGGEGEETEVNEATEAIEETEATEVSEATEVNEEAEATEETEETEGHLEN